MKPTVNRNSPCPCGSGKKFKKCCAILSSPRAIATSEHYNQLGNQESRQRNYELALLHYQMAIDLAPRVAAYHYNQGMVLQSQHKYNAAVTAQLNSLNCNPNFVPAHTNLSTLYLLLGQNQKAIIHAHRAVEFDPHRAQAHLNLGLAYRSGGEFSQALLHLQHGLQLDPAARALNLNNLILLYEDLLDLSQAYGLACEVIHDPEKYHTAIASALRVFGIIGDFKQRDVLLEKFHHLARQGKLDSIVLDPGMLNCNYSARFSMDEMFELHCITGKLLEKQYAPFKQNPTSHNAKNRRLRIGYLSPDFNHHSVARFVAPVITRHDRSRLEITCYHIGTKEDAVTSRFRKNIEHFKHLPRTETPELIEHIRNDNIDILVDLAGYTQGGRLAVLAGRVAPMQLTYLGYPNTTGLSTVDYRISDPYVDCEGGTRYTEKLLRLPECFLCFGEFPQPSSDPSPPALQCGYVTFGCFNNLSKLTELTIYAWAEILKQVSNSRLMIKSRHAEQSIVQNHLYNTFARYGVGSERVILLGWSTHTEDHLSHYHSIDIALDTFPYAGTTTTCEALWMGVPVITLVGARHSQRTGLSILKNVGMDATIATTENEYINCAVHYATQLPELFQLRTELPPRLRNSILCNPERFTQQLETTYEQIWQNHTVNATL
ncbi:MAG: SEC-C domain-containing protein [Gammaproteobacteria bacterium]|nr:SEC-C domain-containing protein [Gammaproteobacteria bacterium]